MLADCLLEGKDAELFLLSPGIGMDTARLHRDRRTQALFPLTDSLFEITDMPIEIALDNEELKSLIACLGVGISFAPLNFSVINLRNLRYHKIVVALQNEEFNLWLIQVFRRYFKEVIDGGFVFEAPPTFGMTDVEFVNKVLRPDQRTLQLVTE